MTDSEISILLEASDRLTAMGAYGNMSEVALPSKGLMLLVK